MASVVSASREMYWVTPLLIALVCHASAPTLMAAAVELLDRVKRYEMSGGDNRTYVCLPAEAWCDMAMFVFREGGSGLVSQRARMAGIWKSLDQRCGVCSPVAAKFKRSVTPVAGFVVAARTNTADQVLESLLTTRCSVVDAAWVCIPGHSFQRVFDFPAHSCAVVGQVDTPGYCYLNAVRGLTGGQLGSLPSVRELRQLPSAVFVNWRALCRRVDYGVWHVLAAGERVLKTDMPLWVLADDNVLGVLPESLGSVRVPVAPLLVAALWHATPQAAVPGLAGLIDGVLASGTEVSMSFWVSMLKGLFLPQSGGGMDVIDRVRHLTKSVVDYSAEQSQAVESSSQAAEPAASSTEVSLDTRERFLRWRPSFDEPPQVQYGVTSPSLFRRPPCVVPLVVTPSGVGVFCPHVSCPIVQGFVDWQGMLNHWVFRHAGERAPVPMIPPGDWYDGFADGVPRFRLAQGCDVSDVAVLQWQDAGPRVGMVLPCPNISCSDQFGSIGAWSHGACMHPYRYVAIRSPSAHSLRVVGDGLRWSLMSGTCVLVCDRCVDICRVFYTEHSYRVHLTRTHHVHAPDVVPRFELGDVVARDVSGRPDSWVPSNV